MIETIIYRQIKIDHRYFELYPENGTVPFKMV
jgi:hypothetical protein